jgi:hypothetical protein
MKYQEASAVSCQLYEFFTPAFPFFTMTTPFFEDNLT